MFAEIKDYLGLLMRQEVLRFDKFTVPAVFAIAMGVVAGFAWGFLAGLVVLLVFAAFFWDVWQAANDRRRRITEYFNEPIDPEA